MPKYEHLARAIRDVPDFPKQGILFKDITTLIIKPELFREIIDIFTGQYRDKGVEKVVAIEARGYLIASALAYRLGAGIVPIRKPGKLPAETVSETYELEYGTDSIEIHRDGLSKGDRVLLVDDLLATGGTAAAACKLIRGRQARILGVAFLVELDFLEGRKRLEEVDIFSIVHF
ncbi:MAG: adenine phosphoribosyltransferase [Candidatus Glassbacteria bacterium]|nr:adenine phosphoribosyltransferase [Candidatus Glassbacteria bacterium]